MIMVPPQSCRHSAALLYVVYSLRCLGQILNTGKTKLEPDHTLFSFASHPIQTRVCQSVLDRDTVDLRGNPHTLHTRCTLVSQICVANVVGDMLS